MLRSLSLGLLTAALLSPSVSAQSSAHLSRLDTDLPLDLWVASPSAGDQSSFVIDCTSESDGESGLTSFFRNGNAGGGEAVFGQSFTAPCDGQIDDIEIVLYSASSGPADASAVVEFILFEGAGGAGTRIQSEQLTIASPTAQDTPESRGLGLTRVYPVTEDQVYTFFFNPLDDNQLQIIGNNAPSYADGDAYVATFGNLAGAQVFSSSATGNNFDVTFQISFEARSVASEAGPEGAAISIGSPEPNPATVVARLPFTLQSAASVRLSVYDMLGREVAVLAEGPFGPGTHGARMDASDLVAGTYVARLVSEDAVVTRTITVVR